ncbi:MAG: S41 family peptidase [Oscillospiraceae bacterium]|nr:S41 family peptidase [Oscillospiraceae bacterium]MBQ8797838.1 S41 family peptidase [Oscillospiraceae bacterium]
MARYQDLPEGWRKFISYTLVAVAASAVTFGICWGKNTTVNYTSNGNFSSSTAKLEQVYNIIQERYIGELDDELLIDAAAQAMVLATGDQWSYYMTPEAYMTYKEDSANAYVGIGVTVNTDTPANGLLIEKVDPNGGAATVGIQAGDWITHIEGVEIYGMPLSDVQQKIRGKEGTSVEMTLNRNGESITLLVPRGTVVTAVATGQMVGDKIGLVTIVNFDERCKKETVAAIESLKEQGAEALIFDVRNNPGGYKSELVELLDFLLPNGVLFRSETYDGKTEVDNSDAGCLEMPMAVLINGDSYSAAEFFAAAMVEYDWAITVGEHTTGKGYFQTNIELSDGSAIHLSVGKFYTPKGVSLAEAKGIAPTHEVKLDETEAEALVAGELAPEDDPQVQKAVEELEKKLK